MNGEEMKIHVDECLRLIGTSFTASTENQLVNAQDALVEARKVLALAQGLAEWCCGRVISSGGRIEYE